MIFEHITKINKLYFVENKTKIKDLQLCTLVAQNSDQFLLIVNEGPLKQCKRHNCTLYTLAKPEREAGEGGQKTPK